MKTDLKNLGQDPLLKHSDLAEILYETCLELARGVCRSSLLRVINDTLHEHLRKQLAPSPHLFVDRLRNALEKYDSLSRQLVHSESAPPLLPVNWLQEARRSLDEHESKVAAKGADGSMRSGEIEFLLPSLLGIFRVAFDIEPDASTAKRKLGSVRGGAFRFIRPTIEKARQRLESRGLVGNLEPNVQSGSERGSALDRVFATVNDDTYRSRLKKALAIQVKTVGLDRRDAERVLDQAAQLDCWMSAEPFWRLQAQIAEIKLTQISTPLRK